MKDMVSVQQFGIRRQTGRYVHDLLIILDGLGSGLGHLGHSLRACAEGFWLKRQGYDWEEQQGAGGGQER